MNQTHIWFFCHNLKEDEKKNLAKMKCAFTILLAGTKIL